MNERIKQLERQATETVKCGLNGTSTTESFNRKKFAELMAKEFIGLLEYEIAMLKKYKTAACNDFDRRWHEGKIVHFHKLIEKTKDHFGVEND